MKITKIEIKHFRGFPGPAVYTFDLPGGKNLLLYGENGSGKSSLYHALNQLFDIDLQAPSFSDLANLFGKDENDQDVTDGHVTVHLDGRPPISLTWPQNGVRPTNPILIDAAMRKGFLEYRSLLQTNFVEGSMDERLFNLAVAVLLARIPVPLSGTPRTVGEYWKDVHKPLTHHKWRLKAAEAAINQFNEAFKAVLPDVEQKAAELLDYFTGHHLNLRLEFEGLVYDKANREIQSQALSLRVEFNGKLLTNHQNFLNEARLSALALALYLASVLLTNPAPGPGVTAPLKLLVLDDVLIGLDLSNRLPLLDILEKHFGDFQVMLSTYDRVWFELARERTEDSKQWVYTELFSDRPPDMSYDIPIIKTDRDLLFRAREHFIAHDYRAAAVYTRSALEARLRNCCERKNLLVRYFKDPRRLPSDELWKAVIGANGRNSTCYVSAQVKRDIEAAKKIILNPLSHAGASSITKAEVDAAIKAVEGLSFT